jgi:hypothetical protein
MFKEMMAYHNAHKNAYNKAMKGGLKGEQT